MFVWEERGGGGGGSGGGGGGVVVGVWSGGGGVVVGGSRGSNEIRQPVVDTTDSSIDRSVGTVDRNVCLDKSQQRTLLRISSGDGLETTKDEWVVGDDVGDLFGNCFVNDGRGEVDGEKDARDGGGSDGFQKKAGVVPGRVGEFAREEFGEGAGDGGGHWCV